MRLRASLAQHVRVADLDLEVDFAPGEEMRTEISTKFTRERIESSYADVGLGLTDWWTDRDGMYALSLARRL
jgi:L-histidine N-alpha-methyltransferase